MRSTMRPMLAALLPLAVAACAGSPPIVASPSACSTLLPDEWLKGVAGATMPADLGTADEILKAWVNFGVEQTAQLDQANGRTADAIGIVRRCEARDATAVKAARPKFLGLF